MSIQELEEIGFKHQAGRVFTFNDMLYTVPEDKPLKNVVEMLLDKVYDIGYASGFSDGKQDLRLAIKQLLNI